MSEILYGSSPKKSKPSKPLSHENDEKKASELPKEPEKECPKKDKVQEDTIAIQDKAINITFNFMMSSK